MSELKWTDAQLQPMLNEIQTLLVKIGQEFALKFNLKRRTSINSEYTKLTLKGVEYKLTSNAPKGSYIEKSDVKAFRDLIEAEILAQMKTKYNIETVHLGSGTYDKQGFSFTSLTVNRKVSEDFKKNKIKQTLQEAMEYGYGKAPELDDVRKQQLLDEDFPLAWYKYKRSKLRVVDIDLTKSVNCVQLENDKGERYQASILYLYMLVAEGVRQE